MLALRRMLQLREGEARRVMWVVAIGVCYAAATEIGDKVSESVFITRVSASSLPRLFLAKGLLDVLAAALYLPLTRARSPSRVWRVAIGIYVITMLVGRLVVDAGGTASAYALYIGHECAWTILTIHWGVFVLNAFDASQARRLFPLLFSAARIGGVVGGALVATLAGRFGAINLLFGCVAFAAAAGVISLLGQGDQARTTARVDDAAPDHARVDEETGPVELPPTGLWDSWKRAAASPLVRTIALSTAAMVLVRYGMRIVSLDMISDAFHNDEDLVAQFNGSFAAFGNVAGVVLGLFVAPKILAWLGVGFANVAYAVGTVTAYALLIGVPSLGAAVAARFTDQQLKDAVKTPLSTLFYGAEPPQRRALARAFIFGAIIPAATVTTAALFEFARWMDADLHLVAFIGAAASLVFVAACSVQNRRWRARMKDLLAFKLAQEPPADHTRLAAASEALAPFRTEHNASQLDALALGLASPRTRLRAVAEEVLAETIPRVAAHRVAQRLAR